MGNKKTATPTKVGEMFRWVRKQSVKVQVLMGAAVAALLLVALEVVVKDHMHFFLASYAVQTVGILLLTYKLIVNKSCTGLSLKSQELTAIFLLARLVCAPFMHTHYVDFFLRIFSLVATLWVIYMLRFKLKSSYNKDLDNLPLHYVLVPCGIAALLTYPSAQSIPLIPRILVAFFLYVEAVAVLPQLRLIQNAKMIEPFTSHYVFALGVARFLGCAHWIIEIVKTKGAYLVAIGTGGLWLTMILISEVVQTFILADFCYYYIKSVMEGEFLMRLPSAV